MAILIEKLIIINRKIKDFTLLIIKKSWLNEQDMGYSKILNESNVILKQ